MDLYDFLSLIGGLCLFLFGMNVMSESLAQRSGHRLKDTLMRLTEGRWRGFFTGAGVTALVQSSSATTVLVVGFVSASLLTLTQAVYVIMGANVGTTVTAWILSLGGIASDHPLLQLLKPKVFAPVVALAGIILYMFTKTQSRKALGSVFLGFATLMFGMETMSAAVSGLQEVRGFRELFLLFRNPILGLLAGALLTAVIQSSSASVGILQALSVTGQVSYAAAIPIILGQNIGTCVTAMLSAVGNSADAKRAAWIHLTFNVLGAMACLGAFSAVEFFLQPKFLQDNASQSGIALCHTVFNLAATALLFPQAEQIRKLVCRIVPEH